MGKGSSARPFSVDHTTYSDNFDAIFRKNKEEDMKTRNPHAVDNVNVAQGPRTGNKGTPAKRGEFTSAKAEREPVAAAINRAYGERAQRDFVDAKAEGIAPNVKPKKFSR